MDMFPASPEKGRVYEVSVESKNALHRVATLTALFGSILFLLPILGSYRSGGSLWPGFMLTGDIRMLWFPHFVEGYHRFWQGSIFGVDFLTHGGSSNFGLRANVMAIYPPFLLTYLILPIDNVRVAGAAFCAMHVIHVYVGLYFSVMLARRFLGLGLGSSVLFAGLYILSYQAGLYVAFTPFFFQLTLVPLLAYTLCQLLYARRWTSSVAGSAIVVLYFLTSYGPTMAAGFCTAVLICLHVLYLEMKLEFDFRSSLRRLALPGLAIGLALLIALPFYLGQGSFFALVPGAPKSLSFIAHGDSFNGRDLFAALSSSVLGASPFEGRMYFGLVPVFVLVIGLTLIALNIEQAPRRIISTLAFSLGLFLFVLLISLGQDTIASDTFFYTAPMLGQMHLYQRFLMFGQLFLSLSVASAAGYIVDVATARQRAFIFTGGLLSWFVVSFWLFASESPPKFIIANQLIAEVLLLFSAMATLALGRSQFAVAMIALPVLTSTLFPWYSLQRIFGKKEISQTHISYSRDQASRIAAALNVDGKVLPKVLNLSDDIDSFLPYNYGWLISRDFKFMNFSGYEQHLATENDYHQMMGGWYGRFNRNWILRTGADFVVWNAPSAWKLNQITIDTVTLGPTMHLGNGLMAARLKYVEAPSIGQKSVLLSFPEADPSAWRASTIDGWRLEGGRMQKTKEGLLHHFAVNLWPVKGATYEVSFDLIGSTKGHVIIAFGGVSGLPVPGNQQGRIAHRYTVTGAGDLWFTGSPDFDGAVTNIVVREIADLPTDEWRPVFDNGMLRLEAGSKNAALTDFRTNWSTRLSATIKGTEPSRLVYLLWANYFMLPYVDGQAVSWVKKGGWPAYLEIPAGTHFFELRFVSGWVRALYIGSLAYFLIAGWVLFVFWRNRRTFYDRIP